MDILIRFLVKDRDIKKPEVKLAYGKITSFVGILLNLLLFTCKFIVGSMCNSVSIIADAFNNLSDAGSSVISFISFVVSNKPADKEHPFGHERFEYISSLVVSFFILFFSFEFFTSSIQSIFNPTVLEISQPLVVVLILSILIKVYMYAYNKKYGRLLDSSVMKASSLDSISDALATMVVLFGLLLSHYINISLDAYLGVFVACLIAKAGIEIVKDTLSKLLGEAPDDSFINMIHEKVMSYDGVYGIHDLVVHSYGSNKTFVTLHVEVSAEADILISHDTIDQIEKDFKVNDNIDLVIHLDPIQMNDEVTLELSKKTEDLLREIDSQLSMHDFRIVKGTTHNNLIFDVVVPFDLKMSHDELIRSINKGLPKTKEGLPSVAVITLDSAYSTKIIK